MNRFLYLIFLIFVSCSLTKQTHLLPKFSYNGKSYNSLIQNRLPDYGDGKPDGCIVMREISLSLLRGDSKKISGLIIDSESKEPLVNARIELLFKSIDTLVVLASDKEGMFYFTPNKSMTEIKIQSVGYRTFIARLKKQLLL